MEQYIIDNLTSPKRQIKVMVSLYSGDTLTANFTEKNAVKEVVIERVGEENKFFGFGICQKAIIKLRDKEREINPKVNDYLIIQFATTEISFLSIFPKFYIQEVKRDENTNDLTITAYDAIYSTAGIKLSQVDINNTSYSIYDLAGYVANTLELTAQFVNLLDLDEDGVIDVNDEYNVYRVLPNGGNFNGEETLREVLNAIAEATGTIYYIDADEVLTFKRLDKFNTVLSITKNDYFTLKSEKERKLDKIAKVTDLGDNVSASNYTIDATQYVRNNAFWEFDEEGLAVVDAFEKIAGLTITPFNCSWRGNFALQIGDRISVVTKDDSVINTYVLDDVITYNGGMKQVTQWSYKDSEETETNPSTLGEVLKQTYARVDKANKQITILTSEANATKAEVATLQLETGKISASVTNMQTTMNENVQDTNEQLETIRNSVEAKMSAEDVTIEIKKELENGVNKVVTSTGFTFDEKGLTVDKTDSEMKTTISEDGMKVYKNDTAMLTADNTGVDAVNLKATTYLIVGTNSRFENYGNNRTGCFWIGG